MPDNHGPAVQRSLFGTKTPMTPHREAEPDRTHLEAANEADKEIRLLNPNLRHNVMAVQSIEGSTFALRGTEKSPRSVFVWFNNQLKAVLLPIHSAFVPLLDVSGSGVDPDTVFSRVANNHLHSVIMQLTTGAARLVVEAQTDPEDMDGHQALLCLANFYAPKNSNCIDELTSQIANTRIDGNKNPALPMVTLQSLRVEYGVEADEKQSEFRMKKDLYNSIHDCYTVAITAYKTNPGLTLREFQAEVQEAWTRKTRNGPNDKPAHQQNMAAAAVTKQPPPKAA